MTTAPLHRVRLQHLRCLLAAVEHGNLNAAARTLALTQSAVTKTIKELEGLVGQVLLARGPRGVTPTPAGLAFCEHAKISMQAIESALRSASPGHEGPLRLGVLPTLSPAFVHDILMQPLPGVQGHAVRTQVVTARNAELLAQLRRGDLDVVIARLAEPDQMMDLIYEPLWAEPMVAAMRTGHPLSTQAWPPLSLERFPLVLPLAGTAIRHAADSFLAARGWVPQGTVLETLVVPLARTMVLQGDAVWLTPRSSVLLDARDGLLAVKPLPGAGAEALGLYRRMTPAEGVRVAALCAVVRDTAAGLRQAWAAQEMAEQELAAIPSSHR